VQSVAVVDYSVSPPKVTFVIPVLTMFGKVYYRYLSYICKQWIKSSWEL